MPDCTYTFTAQLKFNPYQEQPSKVDLDIYLKSYLEEFVRTHTSPYDPDFSVSFEIVESTLVVTKSTE